MKNTDKLLAIATAGLPRKTVKLSDGTELKLRAFAVKELKLLMMAHESNSAQDYQVIQILNQCIETDGIDAATLASHDVEILYLELYKISKGTSFIPVKYHCNNEHDGKKCGTDINVNINLNNVTVDEMPERVVTLANGLVLNMRFPTILEREYFSEQLSDIFNLAMRCIVSIDTGSELMVVGQDITEEELSEVIEYLDEKSFDDMFDFVSSIPTIQLSFPIKCPKCGHEEVVTLRGIDDFFD